MVRSKRTIKDFWTIFFGTLAALAIGIALAVYFMQQAKIDTIKKTTISDENVYKIQLENKYKESLYIATDSMKNIDANLGKIAVSQDKAHQLEMLVGVTVHANNVNQNLANLPVSASDNLMSIQKFVNQTQDYSIALMRKLTNGQSLEKADRSALGSLNSTAKTLTDRLTDMLSNDSAMFITNGMGLDGASTLDDGISQIEENVFQYEKLIYDGPFSDSTEKKYVKCEKTLSGKDGIEKVKEIFEGVTEVTYDGSINSQGEFYAYTLKTNDGEIRVLLTTDGRVAEYEYYMDNGDQQGVLKTEDCISVAEETAQKFGFDVKAVWVSQVQDATTYVNLAPVTEDGTIIYPDLVKISVDTVSGKAVGMESRAYLINHTQRQINKGEVTVDQAQQGLDESLKVQSVNSALVLKNGTEYVCHEFMCESDNRQYFVYVDTVSGNEVELFKVIENTEGYTVM